MLSVELFHQTVNEEIIKHQKVNNSDLMEAIILVMEKFDVDFSVISSILNEDIKAQFLTECRNKRLLKK